MVKRDRPSLNIRRLGRWYGQRPRLDPGSIPRVAVRPGRGCEGRFAVSDELRGPAVIEQTLDLLRQVYEQAGNAAPAERRHVLTPGLRDSIRDCLKQAESDQLPVTEEWLRAVGSKRGRYERMGQFCLPLSAFGIEVFIAFENGTATAHLVGEGKDPKLCDVPTRGHVRRLCQCLGIALKESS
jgi:hypothetical protein